RGAAGSRDRARRHALGLRARRALVQRGAAGPHAGAAARAVQRPAARARDADPAALAAGGNDDPGPAPHRRAARARPRRPAVPAPGPAAAARPAGLGGGDQRGLRRFDGAMRLLLALTILAIAAPAAHAERVLNPGATLWVDPDSSTAQQGSPEAQR